MGDQILTPTSAKELAGKVRQLVDTGAYGLYHITNNDECSWFQFVGAIFELSGLRPNLTEMTSAAFGARAVRPPYPVLQNAALQRLCLDNLRPW